MYMSIVLVMLVSEYIRQQYNKSRYQSTRNLGVRVHMQILQEIQVSVYICRQSQLCRCQCIFVDSPGNVGVRLHMSIVLVMQVSVHIHLCRYNCLFRCQCTYVDSACYVGVSVDMQILLVMQLCWRIYVATTGNVSVRVHMSIVVEMQVSEYICRQSW